MLDNEIAKAKQYAKQYEDFAEMFEAYQQGAGSFDAETVLLILIEAYDKIGAIEDDAEFRARVEGASFSSDDTDQPDNGGDGRPSFGAIWDRG